MFGYVDTVENKKMCIRIIKVPIKNEEYEQKIDALKTELKHIYDKYVWTKKCGNCDKIQKILDKSQDIEYLNDLEKRVEKAIEAKKQMHARLKRSADAEYVQKMREENNRLKQQNAHLNFMQNKYKLSMLSNAKQ